MTSAIKQNYSIKNLTTFHLNTNTKYFIEIQNIEDLRTFIQTEIKNYEKVLILGGGSNLLFKSDFNGLVIHPKIMGIEIIEEKNDFVLIKVGCGEIWDEFVEYCVINGYGGIENLSKIPGFIGAAPIQNIGAYGVEVKDVIEKVFAIEIETGKVLEIKKDECQFEYRNSIFKKELKNKYIITGVIVKLHKKHQLNTRYGKVEEQLRKFKERNILNVRKAIIKIRTEKLPDPDKIGNAGSFFKNPVVSMDYFNTLKNDFSTIPSFPVSDELVKIPAAWLIEQCGWKGYRDRDAGVYPKQSLVLVNYGNANGEDIYNLSERIRKSVVKKFKINLEREVTVIGNQ